MLHNKAIQFIALLVGLSSALIFADLLASAPKASLAQDGSWYIIRAKHSNQCLNILNGSFDNGAPAVQGNRCNTPNFFWKLVPVENTNGNIVYRFVARHSNQCLNVLNGSGENGASVVQGNRCDTPNFLWTIRQRPRGYVLIINKQTGQCLNVLNGSFNNGGLVVQGTACNTPNFEWMLEKVEE
ncbi:RICIN domain-containing protein [Microcoleus vaginatus DQ-U2]|uniref:RICIN domain-containing protein n=1 Tax=Microcoleus vaginatus TaxID=119532 RepID=UPI001685445A|nr:RICIN domain-containing protein [Microcoleus sp. FACHB-DQ6]